MEGVKDLKYQKRLPTFLILEQIDRLLDACDDPLLYRFVLLGAYTGMRRSEIEELKWSDVDFERAEIRVQGNTKNNDYRIVPMADPVKEVLKEAQTPFQEHVLVRPDGRPCRRMEDPFARALERADLPKIRLHDLRHSFASNLVSNGTPLNVVQELLGHKDIKTTMVYAHLAPNAKRAAVDSLAQRRKEPGQEDEREPAATG